MTLLEKSDLEPAFSMMLYSSKGATSRNRILTSLQSGSKSCNLLATELRLNWRTIYRHLKILEKWSLVKSFDFGERKFYKLTMKGEEASKISLNARQL